MIIFTQSDPSCLLRLDWQIISKSYSWSNSGCNPPNPTPLKKKVWQVLTFPKKNDTRYSTAVLAHDSQYLSFPTMQDNAVYLKCWVSKKTDITKGAMLTYSLCPASVWISWLLVSIFISVHSAQFRLLWILLSNRWISPHICTNKFAPTVLVHFLKNDVIQSSECYVLVALCSANLWG